MFAIRFRSAADSFSALAFPPWLAILVISEAVRCSARALPPRLPSACACGFFFWPMHQIILLSTKHVNGIMQTTGVFSPATHSAWVTPIQTERIAQAGCKECARLSGFVHGYGSESRIPALSTGTLAPRNRSGPGHFHWFGTSMGHQAFLRSCSQSLRAE